MIVVTTEDVAKYRITKTFGQVYGVIVRSRGIGGNIMAGLRSIIGGEINEYTALVEDTRRQAIDRMSSNAKLMGANAVVRMMFDSSQLGTSMNEVVAYGTAVTIEKIQEHATP
jgi:uncharacterized protein YbjQ (UPF0145 family)